jgi:hypothetical protein
VIDFEVRVSHVVPGEFILGSVRFTIEERVLRQIICPFWQAGQGGWFREFSREMEVREGGGSDELGFKSCRRRASFSFLERLARKP